MVRRSRFLVIGAVVLQAGNLLLAPNALSGNKKERNQTVKEVVSYLNQAKIKSISVPDFLDSDETRRDRGALLAASFSKLLSERAKTFRVIDRSTVQKAYNSSKPSIADLQTLDGVSQVAKDNGADAILWGKIARDAKSLTIELSVVDCRSEKELHHIRHLEEPAPYFEAHFPATSESSGGIFYFAGMDGISIPKCTHCPDPSYTDPARRDRITGVVHLSLIITAQGTSEAVRIVKQLEPTLDQAALNAVKAWRFELAKGPDQNPVPVRMVIEVSFDLR